jgi:hypothetical protein
MIIAHAMNLGQLLELMPADATYHEAYTLRAALIRDYHGQRTQDIPAPVWADLITDAMKDIELCQVIRRTA